MTTYPTSLRPTSMKKFVLPPIAHGLFCYSKRLQISAAARWLLLEQGPADIPIHTPSVHVYKIIYVYIEREGRAREAYVPPT